MIHYYNLLGYIQQTLGSNKEALMNLHKAESVMQELGPEEAGLRLQVNKANLAWVYFFMGEMDESKNYLEEVKSLQRMHPAPPGCALHPEVSGEKGWTLVKFNMSKKRQAIDYLKMAIKAEPERKEWHKGLAMAMSKTNPIYNCSPEIKADILKQLEIAHKSNQITFIVTSPQHKCLGEWNSYERAPDSAKKTTDNLPMDRQCKKTTNSLPMDRRCKKTTNSLPMDRQCKKNNKQFTYGQTVQKNNKQFTYGQTVQKNNKQFTYGQTVQKKQQTIYIWTDSAKKTTNNLHMDRQCKKNNNNLHMDRQCKKNNKQFTYGQTVQKTTAIYIWTVHIYRLYRRQCAKYTYIYSVRLVYYRDILNYQRHIIHRMGTSTLCTVYIHNVVYT